MEEEGAGVENDARCVRVSTHNWDGHALNPDPPSEQQDHSKVYLRCCEFTASHDGMSFDATPTHAVGAVTRSGLHTVRRHPFQCRAMFSAAGTTATLRFVSWWGAFVVGRRHTGQRRAVSHWRRTSLRTRCADDKRQGAVEEEAVDEEEEQEVVVEERAREPLLVFRDDFKMMPGLMPSTVTFKEERTVQKPASEKESFPREGREHKRLLGPGTAVLSSLMCGGYGYLAWLVRASPLPGTSVGLESRP